jgi:DNA-binding CsgD family transcriptional regulator
MSSANAELQKIYELYNYSRVEQSDLEKHIDYIKRFASETSSMIAIYEIVTNKRVYVSDDYLNNFGNDSEFDAIHPDDYEAVLYSSAYALQYLHSRNLNIADYRLIRKYRAKMKEEYQVVIEQLRPFAFDNMGNPSLSLVMIDVSPNQSLPHDVEYKMLNIKTSEVIFLSGNSNFGNNQILSAREIEILRLIERGMTSSEISKQISISVHIVNTHRQHILDKLKVHTSFQAVKHAIRLGII